MDEHLSIALNALIKFLVCSRCIINTDLMRNNERRISTARDDHVAEVAVVFLDVALARAEREALS